MLSNSSADTAGGMDQVGVFFQDFWEVGTDAAGVAFGEFRGQQVAEFVEILGRGGELFFGGKVVPVIAYPGEGLVLAVLPGGVCCQGL